jgi:hypothetical protein
MRRTAMASTRRRPSTSAVSDRSHVIQRLELDAGLAGAFFAAAFAGAFFAVDFFVVLLFFVVVLLLTVFTEGLGVTVPRDRGSFGLSRPLPYSRR